MFEYEEQRGKVECEECPSCGRPRPIDWFVREGGPCWRCRALGKVPAGPQGEARGRGFRRAAVRQPATGVRGHVGRGVCERDRGLVGRERPVSKVINGKVYDTDKARLVADADNGCLPGDLDYYCEALYRKRTGEYFLHVEGGARSIMAKSCGSNSWSGSSEIRPLSYDAAEAWAEKNMDGDAYQEAFGEIEEDGGETARLTFTLPAGLKERLEREAARQGTTMGAVIVDALRQV